MIRVALVLGAVGCSSGGKHVPVDARDPPPDEPGDATPAACGDACGGACPPCGAGRQCQSGSDCATGYCSGTGTCALGEILFAGAVSYAASFKPYVMLSGDLDGDGRPDLAVANEEADTISVFRNLGSGMFAAVAAPTPDGFPTGAYPTGGAIADFDRDGIPDVITANFHGDSVTIMRGAGTGDAYTLMPPASYATAAGGETSNLAVGDLNGDGIPDVIATNPQASSISVFIAGGGGTLMPARNIAIGRAGDAQPYSVAIGDFDGDGIADAAVADDASASLVIELGTGDGTFRLAPAQPAIGGVQSFIVVARDMNRDGKLDLVVANRSSDDVSVLLGGGDGSFGAALVSSTGSGTGPYSLAVADFDLDGVPDVVTADYLSSTASVLLGRGDGTFRAPIEAGKLGESTYGIAAADFNGDGKPDLATANALSNDMTVALSTSH